MQKLFALFLISFLGLAPVFSQSGAPGDLQIDVKYKFNTIPVRIAGDAQLTALANQAFQSHGRFDRVAGGESFVITFNPAGANQVRVDVTKKDGSSVLSQTVSGATQQQALYRAADVAVKATSGINGFFASKLAFVSNRTGSDEIYVSDLFLNSVVPVTQQRSHVLTPRWAPDGSRLLYTSYFKSGFPDIFSIDLSAGRWNTFVSFNGTNSGARFSADGSQVAMVLTGNGSPNVYVSDASGRNVARRTNTPETKSSPCFSPDGSRIVFVMEPGPQLYVMSAAGGTPTRLATSSNYSAEPDWSRTNPNLIVYTTRQGGAFRIAVLDLSTGTSRVIPAKDAKGNAIGGDLIEASWLADGRHVVCTARTANQRSLYILDTEEKSGNRATKISAIYAEKGSPWGP